MKKITIYFLGLLLCPLLLSSCNNEKGKTTAFVKVKGSQFEIDGKPYYFLGTNFWYGMNLGSKGKGGNRERLIRELDRLQSLGINNLRIVALSEGPDNEPYRMVPAVQTKPGELNEELLEGLDFLLIEMSKRKMYAVVCLANFWPWSGGMGQYIVWNGGADSIPYPPPHPGGSWDTYQKFTAKFYSNQKAVEQYWSAVQKIVTRTNSISKKAYTEDPTIMAWQLCNEPRGLDNPDDFNKWIDSTAGLIKSLDKNHLVTTGSEGYTPWPEYTATDFFQNHDGNNIDYTTVHIWVENWEWFDPAKHEATYDSSVAKMKAYLKKHVEAATQLGKPLVLEEFGIARDNGSFEPEMTVELRDKYYRTIFSEVHQYASSGTPLSGVNFWAWGGEGRPKQPKTFWKAGDDFIGDPPHEFQGWYSVYEKDSTTQKVIKEFSEKMNGLK